VARFCERLAAVVPGRVAVGVAVDAVLEFGVVDFTVLREVVSAA
jgi:hypothetical protein